MPDIIANVNDGTVSINSQANHANARDADSGTVTSATLRFRGQGSNSNADIIVMKSDAFGGDGGTALANTDFNAIVGQTDGESMSVSSGCVEYSDELATWNTSDINSITLTAAALSDMESDDFFIIALVQFDNDYLNVDVPIPVSIKTGMKLSEVSTTSQKPTLRYNLGYSNDVIGLASGDIGEINAVATADIAELNGL